MQEGTPVTVAAAAEKHGISKATAYRYFSDASLMVAEAGLDIHVADYEAVIAGASGLRSKLKAISMYFFNLSITHEVAFRQFVGMTLVASASEPKLDAARRGARRLAMYRRAFDQDGCALEMAQRERLVRALAGTTGAEAMIAMLDVVGVNAATARETVEDITDAILDRYLGAKIS